MSIKVIVLAVEENGLGATRSLGVANVPFGVIAFSKNDVCLKSKYPSKKLYIEGPTEDEKESQILNILSDYGNRNIILIPTSDWYVKFLDKYRETLGENFKLSLPPVGLPEQLIDKQLEIELIGGTIPIPASLSKLPENEQEMLKKLRLPIIIKPRSHVMNVLNRKNVILSDENEVRDFYKEYKNDMSTMIAQEVVPGSDDCLWVCNCFFDKDSELCTALVFRRLRTAPAHFGVTSYARSEYNEKVIACVKLVGKKLKYVGPIMVEFKYDSRDDEYKYIEINPRLGMCNFFDTYCGQNNVFSTYCLHSEQDVPVLYGKQKNKVVFFNFFDDVYSRHKDGESFFSILKDYISDMFKQHVYAYFYWKDPVPYIYILNKQLVRVFGSLLNKLKRQ